MKGSLSVGQISWMFWEALMETGEVRLPIPPSEVLGRAKRERKREGARACRVQNVFTQLCIKLSENKPSLAFTHSAVPASKQVDPEPLIEAKLPWDREGGIKRKVGIKMISC